MAAQLSDDPKFFEIQGDLFVEAPPSDSLVHCVSEDLQMNRGIAVAFRDRFAGIDELKAQGRRTGEVAFLERDGRYVFYLITKAKYLELPKREDFAQSLSSLRKLCGELAVTGISMPRIGSGLDKLPLEFVHDTIKKEFAGSSVRINMYYR